MLHGISGDELGYFMNVSYVDRFSAQCFFVCVGYLRGEKCVTEILNNDSIYQHAVSYTGQ